MARRRGHVMVDTNTVADAERGLIVPAAGRLSLPPWFLVKVAEKSRTQACG